MSFYCAVNTTTFNSTGHISHSSWVGAGNANWSIEWDFVCTSLAADRYLAGNNSGSATRSVRINTDGTIRVNGVAAITVSPSGTVSAGVRYNVKLESVGTTKSLYIKLATDSSYGSAACTGTDNFAYTFNTICRASAVYSRFFNIYGASTIGGTYSEVWDGGNAPLAGTTWTGSNGGALTLNGTQSTADAWWVFYSSGDTITSTAAWSITPIQWQGSAAVAAPTFSSTAAWSVSPMQWQGAANATPPVFNSVTAWSISPLQWQAAAAPTAPGAIVSAAAWTISQLQWQATAQPAPVVQSSAAWSISPLNWQGATSATVPAFTASAAWSISPMQWQASATAAAPGATASTVSWSISPMRWQGSVAATVPTFNAAAAWTISPMVWQVSASIAGAPVFAAKGATITERFGSHAIIERLQTARIYE
jgi:hypothetical protein